MATSGYKDVAATYTTSGNVGDTLRFRWQLKSSSVIDNQSTINWWLELIAGGAGYISSSATKSWNVTVNGTSYSGSNTVGISNNTTKTLASGTTVVPHNADGTKTFTYSFSQVFNITFNKYVGTVSGSGSGVLDSIPRSSTISKVEGDTIGGEVTVTLARHNDAFTHQMRYKVGESTWYDLGSGIGTSKTFTIDPEASRYITDDVTGTMQLCVRTYSGSTQIGTDTYKNVVVKVPDDVIPIINSITITEAVSGLASKFGAFIQNKSKLQIACDASGASGSTIKSYKAEVSGANYTGQTIITDLISQSGDVPVKVTVTDSRGRTSTGTTSVTVLEYYLPTIERFDAYRSDAAGNEKNSSKTLACAYKFKVAPCGNKNDRTYKIEYRQTGAANWTTIASGSLYAADTKLIKEDILGLEYSYEVRLTVNDYFGTPATYPVKVGMEVVVWCPYPTGKGLGIGGYPKGEYLDVYMDALFNQQVRVVGNDIYIDNKNGLFGKDTNGNNLALAQTNESDHSAFGYGGYEKKVGATYLYGNNIRLVSNGDIQITSPTGGIKSRQYGVVKVLATTQSFMQNGQSITLSEAVSAQPNGIVLVWSEYGSGAGGYASNSGFNSCFVSKYEIVNHSSAGHNFLLSCWNTTFIGCKYVYISDTMITGADINNQKYTSPDTNNVIFHNNRFVLRYVLGI